MTSRDPLASNSQARFRKHDQIAQERHGCRFADLPDNEAIEIVYEMCAENDFLAAAVLHSTGIQAAVTDEVRGPRSVRTPSK